MVDLIGSSTAAGPVVAPPPQESTPPADDVNSAPLAGGQVTGEQSEPPPEADAPENDSRGLVVDTIS
ncbi:MAG: hypothetical protein V3V62_06435 [bacterium]